MIFRKFEKNEFLSGSGKNISDTFSLELRHFVNSPFCQFVISSSSHFVSLLIHQIDLLKA